MQIEFTVTGLKPTQRKRVKTTRDPRPVTSVVKTVVLAFQIDQAVREGRARDFAEVARQTGLTRARVSQVMRLLRLPPSILDALLLGPHDEIDRISERRLRPILSIADAQRQVEEFERLCGRSQSPTPA